MSTINRLSTFAKDSVGIFRCAALLASFGIVHFWAFVNGLPGNISYFVGSDFFIQFQALFAGHIAIVAAAVTIVSFIIYLLHEVVKGFWGSRKIMKFINLLDSNLARVLLFVVLLSSLYTGNEFLRIFFPFLFDPYNNFWEIIPPVILGSLLIWSTKARRKRETKSAAGESQSLTWSEISGSKVSGQIAAIIVSIAYGSLMLGGARADFVIATEPSEIQTKTGYSEITIIGTNGSYIIGYKVDCACIVLIPDGEVVQVIPYH